MEDDKNQSYSKVSDEKEQILRSKGKKMAGETCFECKIRF